MTTLRLHRELYSLAAVERASDAFSALCQRSMVTEDAHYVLTVTTNDDADAPLVAGELANYALAATIEERKR